LQLFEVILSSKYLSIRTKKHIVYIFSSSQLCAESLCGYLESLPDIVVSGISVQITEPDKIFQLLRIDIAIIISHHTSFLVSMLEKIETEKTSKNILVISPVEFFKRQNELKTKHNIQFASFEDKLEAIQNRLDSLKDNGHGKLKDKKNEILHHITTREKAILDLINRGKKTKEIAEELFLSAKTVENYKNNILKKTKTKSMITLIKELYKLGLYN
jgi:DNA-binding NarL/FixJ family response regulator